MHSPPFPENTENRLLKRSPFEPERKCHICKEKPYSYAVISSCEEHSYCMECLMKRFITCYRKGEEPTCGVCKIKIEWFCHQLEFTPRSAVRDDIKIYVPAPNSKLAETLTEGPNSVYNYKFE